MIDVFGRFHGVSVHVEALRMDRMEVWRPGAAYFRELGIPPDTDPDAFACRLTFEVLGATRLCVIGVGNLPSAALDAAMVRSSEEVMRAIIVVRLLRWWAP